jgi:precorrin-2/cobalt-factor-2 C20-methyltransferase
MAGEQAMVKPGTLYGVGVGPGDPELMTVKAWRLLSTVPVIAYLAANGGDSAARAIAKPFIPDDIIELAIDVPMRPDPEPAQNAYDTGCAAISDHLRAGRDAAMLCEGDPFFYGSFAYIFERLSASFETIVVPGVTSITASAARLGRPLVSRNQVLKVIPATLDANRLREELASAESAAIIKVGRHFGKVREVLASLELTSKSIIIEKATHEDESVAKIDDVIGDALPYFTTILVLHGAKCP